MNAALAESLDAYARALGNVEALEWTPVTAALPDDGVTVLTYAPAADEPVWFGYHDDYGWIAVGGNQYPYADVTHWAPMPRGPNTGSSSTEAAK